MTAEQFYEFFGEPDVEEDHEGLLMDDTIGPQPPPRERLAETVGAVGEATLWLLNHHAKFEQGACTDTAVFLKCVVGREKSLETNHMRVKRAIGQLKEAGRIDEAYCLYPAAMRVFDAEKC